MVVFLSYFLITLIENQLEKFFLSSMWNLETVCEHIGTQWKVFSIKKSECLTQPIQMQLSRNYNIFSWFFSAFSKSTENFEYFGTKDEPQRWFFSGIRDCKKPSYLNA